MAVGLYRDAMNLATDGCMGCFIHEPCPGKTI
jgi:hypothetical protein